MKILAAVMDISFVKYCGKRRDNYIHKVKRYMVYNPSKVTPCHIGKKVKDD